MDDPIQRYRTKSRDRQRHRRKSLRSIERLQHEVYKTKQTISSVTDHHQVEMSLSQQSDRRSRRGSNVKGDSNSSGYGACQFDAKGYCIVHPDVRLVKMKAGEWKVVREHCHKCFRRTHSSSTVLTGDSFHEESNRHQEARSQRGVHQRSRGRGRCRERDSRDEHRFTQQHSRSKSIRSRSKSLRRKIQQLTPTRTICVDGAPFDKNGRCFVHNHIKLASRKLLGGWKIHFQFCPQCARDDDYVDSHSVISDISGLSVESFISGCESRSYKSMNSQRSWSSKQSKKRIDDSFLPLDEDGYCLHHPDVQLAEMCKKGGWNVLLDFCPECAEETLIIGGPVSRPRRSSHYSRRFSVTSSVKSSKSGESEGTLVTRMPYIDGEGQTGYYSGHVNADGKPSGRGKMRYKNRVWDGVWEEGTKIHGKTILNKGKTKTSTSDLHQLESKHHHSRIDEQHHTEQKRKSGSRMSPRKNKFDKL